MTAAYYNDVNTMLEELHKQSKIICYNEDSSLLQGIHYFPNSGQLLVFSVHTFGCAAISTVIKSGKLF